MGKKKYRVQFNSVHKRGVYYTLDGIAIPYPTTSYFRHISKISDLSDIEQEDLLKQYDKLIKRY